MGDMDEEMVDEIAEPFVAVEIDLDYEFDAARYFDFSRDESPAEALQAELWFESAKSYPPSPFVAKLVLREDILLGNVNTSPKSKDMEIAVVPDSDSAVALGQEIFTMDANNRDCGGTGGTITNLQSGYLQNVYSQAQESISGLTFYNHMLNDNPKAKTKSTVKSVLPRSSTLMKPTASQLAKQNRPHQVGSFRFQTLLAQNNERGCINSSGVESQAAKRQKLEGGHLFKVADTKEQTNLVHKVPKKDATVDGNSMQARLKLTIPREPNLETAHRTQRMRPKHHTEVDQVALNVHRFKARPLNRKILEAPSLPLPKKSTPRLPEFQEFHLKTSERARQHTAGSSSSLHCNDPDKKPSTNSVPENGNKDLRRPNTTDAPKQDACETVRTFKARPLNRKIFSSKGDIGVFRNSKRETTVPLEFNFQTEKRAQHNPPIELFNKLSLTSELQQKNDSQFKVPQPTCVSTKGSKENRLGFSQPEHEITYLVKDKLPQSRGVQIQCGSNGGINEIDTRSGISRSLGIR
ncbi:hypothetical protein PVL29_001953 [Vitis rotundifolia]|uniref:TPX2 central domain-containing protein n=1 Tax=Vitis rotundifolia TaxID=103349 RepID=A0AA39E6X6_VITRO|nr:hypothetical protein PVL29_001953 [Vitis rotundifolia]